VRDGAAVLEALGELPGGPALLELARDREDVALVGGAVRDLLLERPPRELDVVVECEAAEFAHELASRIGTPGDTGSAELVELSSHERFGTALLRWNGGEIDVATRRTESYAAPGALPDVRAGTADEDLNRRDFTVNAIAVPLGGPRRGQPIAADHALEDLAARRLRVLHERSFIEDPTRLLRLARYCARLDFQPEPHTAELAAEAIAAGALETVSPARIGAELRLALAEADPVAALTALADLGVLAALEPRLKFDPDMVRGALALLPEDGRADLLLLASLFLEVTVDPAEDPEEVMFELLDGWEFTAADRQRVMQTALVAPALEEEMELAELPSELHEVLFSHTVEAAALGGALGNASTEAREWIETLRHVRLEITGADLLAAGIPTGPEIGRRLSAVLDRKLDRELDDGREAELRAAIEDRG
jgi:tRNA nucleotidyltransferase (CCA-adding enzyme)